MNTKVRVVSALWFLLVAHSIERVAMSFAGPSIMKSLSISPAQFGLVLSSLSFGYFLSLLPGGLITDRWGARLVLVVAPILWAVFTGLTGLVSTVAGFMIVRTCFGFFEGVCKPADYTVIGENFDSRGRSSAMALFSTAGPLSSAFAGTLIGALILWQGWRVMFLFMMIPGILASLAAWHFIPGASSDPALKSASKKGNPSSFRAVAGEPTLWLVSLAALFWNIPYWGFVGWLPSYLTLAHHIKLEALGPLSSIPFIFGFVGMVVGGWLGSRLHRYCLQIVMISFVCASLCLFLAYQAPSLPLTIAGLSGTAVFLYGVTGPKGSLVLALAPEQHRASYASIYTAAGQVGAMIAPATIGFLVSATGSFAAGFSFMIASFIASAACLLPLVRVMPSTRTPRILGAEVSAT